MLPDIDPYLPAVVHHGITDTVLFVAISAILGGALLTIVATAVLRRWRRRTERESVSRWSIYRFVVSGLFVGGLSHLFIDMLSAGAGGNPPLEPFWPVFTKPFSIDFIYYDSFRWNGGLLVVALGIHAVLLSLDETPITPSY